MGYTLRTTLLLRPQLQLLMMPTKILQAKSLGTISLLWLKVTQKSRQSLTRSSVKCRLNSLPSRVTFQTQQTFVTMLIAQPKSGLNSKLTSRPSGNSPSPPLATSSRTPLLSARELLRTTGILPPSATQTATAQLSLSTLATLTSCLRRTMRLSNSRNNLTTCTCNSAVSHQTVNTTRFSLLMVPTTS